MKIAILNDTHCGARNSSNIFIKYQEDFYKTQFWPYLEKHGIDRIIHLGDYYEHRKFVNFKALQSNNEVFLDELSNRNTVMDIIPGNHDVYYKNTNNLCSLQPLMGAYLDYVNIHMDPVTLDYDGFKIDLIPWINSENYTEIMEFVKKSDSTVCMGHFEFAGFELYPGQIAQSGMSPKEFDKYDMVLSGHYHTRSNSGNVTYLGAQMEFTWGDVDDPKYFHIFDTETGEIKAILNPLTLFQKVVYNDSKFDYNSFDYSIFDEKFVKVIVDKRTDPYLFDKFIDNIQHRNIHDLKITENFDEFMGESVEEEIEFEETSDLLAQYVDAVDTPMDKDVLKSKLHSLYLEAGQLEFE